jgi:hypothetical protein
MRLGADFVATAIDGPTDQVGRDEKSDIAFAPKEAGNKKERCGP